MAGLPVLHACVLGRRSDSSVSVALHLGRGIEALKHEQPMEWFRKAGKLRRVGKASALCYLVPDEK
jgi:hypothetical protein